MIKLTLINDMLSSYDIPFAMITATSVAAHVEDWSHEVLTLLYKSIIINYDVLDRREMQLIVGSDRL